MGRVEELERQIRELPYEEFAQLRDLIAGVDAQVWDTRFEADVRAGKLNALGEAARRAPAEGKSTRL